jgi:hypothetical protein
VFKGLGRGRTLEKAEGIAGRSAYKVARRLQVETVTAVVVMSYKWNIVVFQLYKKVRNLDLAIVLDQWGVVLRAVILVRFEDNSRHHKRG